MTDDDPYSGVDLDHCRDPETGIIQQWALDIVEMLNSYTEVSPSGAGLRIFVRGDLPAGRRKKGAVEMYDAERYLTVTGDHLAGTPTVIEERGDQLAALHVEVFGVEERHEEGAQAKQNLDLSDQDLLDKAAHAKDGAKFLRLWDGDMTGYPSQSEADLALCSLLAFWTGRDRDRIDRLFRASGLHRDKWDSPRAGGTYGASTIEYVLSKSGETYGANGATPKRNHHADTAATDDALHAERFAERSANDLTDEGDYRGNGPAALLDAGDGDLPRISRKSWKAVTAANDPPSLFQQAGLPAWIETIEGSPVIRQLSLDKLRHHVARVGDWYRDTPIKGGAQVKRQSAPPPMVVVRDMMADPAPPLPVLTRIVEAPAFGPDGVLNDAPGYHPSSRTYYAGGVEVKDGVTAVIEDLLCDFPFVSKAEKAHAIALMILPFVRDMIVGPTPLHLIEKPAPGTGGTLLADMLLFPALGRTPTAMTEGRDEDEWRKRITARLAGGSSVILIDNLRRRLDAAALSAVVTATTWEDRILGKSETITLPVRCAWVATGNNPAVSNEMARRTVRIRLDAKRDKPWERERSGFRHPDIRRWSAARRGEIVGAIIKMVTRWLEAGRPRPDASLGGFESWSDVIGGVLKVNGIEGFLANSQEFYDVADEETAAWRSLLESWWEKYQSEPIGTGTLWLLISSESIAIPLGKGGEQAQKVNLGRQLRERRDRQFGDLRLTSAGAKKRAQQYRLEQVK